MILTKRNECRNKDFFKENLNLSAKGEMSEVCKIAHFIYEIWKEHDNANFYDYLVEELNCSEDHAKSILIFYNPKNPPSDICPIGAVENGKYHEVFIMLSLQIDGIWPKNLLAWYVMKYVYGSDVFDFEIIGKGTNSHDNKIIFPNLILGSDGNPLPLTLAALNAIKVGNLPASIIKKAGVLISELGCDIGEDLAKTLYEADFIFPPKRILNQLVKVIKRGLAGEEIVVTGAFCPDYSYRETGNKNIPYEYTFDNIGDGVGLVAQQLVRVLPDFIKFFRRYNIKYYIKFGIGDFEANSKEILESVGVDKTEFIARCARSLRAFKESLAYVKDLDLDLCLFEENWANGRWQRYVSEAYDDMMNGNFGNIKSFTGKNPKTEVVQFTARNSASFYRKWYKNPQMPISEIENLVIAQGSEYAAMGRVLSEDFGDRPFIQLAGDRPKMQVFNSFFSEHPTLCTRRVY